LGNLGYGSIIKAINGINIHNGISDYQNIVRGISDGKYLWAKCVDLQKFSRNSHCCSSISLDYSRNPDICLWDVKSMKTYNSIFKSINLNVIPQQCFLMDGFFADGLNCISDQDCNIDQKCMAPFTPSDMKSIYFEISGKIVEFTGDADKLFSSLLVSQFIPKYQYLPIYLPLELEFFLRYIYSLNITLGIMNIIPAFNFDGANALRVLFNTKPLIFLKIRSKKAYEKIITINSGLFLCFCAKVIFSSLK
jgi:hypothetical protein